MGWVEQDTGLERNFEFRDFAHAWTFMCRIAAEAEKMDHHPDWSNSYNKVSIRLRTHSKDGITDLNRQLATKIDSFLED